MISLAFAKPLKRRIAIALPFIQTAIWVLSPIWSQPAAAVEPVAAAPDLGAELEDEALISTINRAVSKPAPVVSVAQAISEPVATLSVPTEPAAEPATEPAEEVEGEPVAKSITEQEQAIVGSASSVTVKLRQLAKLHQIPNREGGIYRRNPDLRLSLQPLVAVALP